MDLKNPQGSTPKPKLFKINAESYEEDMETELAKGKKKEIIDLLNNYNNIRSSEEFKLIKLKLRVPIRNGDLDLIKIYLSETIKDDSETLKYKIDETNRTASLYDIQYGIEEVTIPRTVKHKSNEYLITSISGVCSTLRTLKFVEDSAVDTIYGNTFPCLSPIYEIYFPASLKKLKKGWCDCVTYLNDLIISPLNGQFIMKDDELLLGKSDENSDEFDIVLFAYRSTSKISIPSNIKFISPYAFNDSYCLNEIEFQPNSNLQIIGTCAFWLSKIKEISIPASVTKICEAAFSGCTNLKKIEIPPNSKLQTIECGAFSNTEISEIYFPPNLKELKEGWCNGAKKLARIIVSPLNGQFIMKDDKFLLGKSDENNDEFDKIVFAPRYEREISIPPNIKIISSYAFYNFEHLVNVKIPADSNLQTIESYAFAYSSIYEFVIPPKLSKICDHALASCPNLKKVVIPENSDLQIIGPSAFLKSKIKEIFIPSKVSIICEDAFGSCEQLANVIFPPNSNLQIIESGGFINTAIEEIVLPSTVSKICSSAFQKCSKLKKVEFPENSNLQSIGSHAFIYSPINELHLPASLKELKEGWCSGTSCLDKITISPKNGQFKMMENKCIVSKSDENKDDFDILQFACRDIKEISIPSNIKIISQEAFEKCYSLTKVEIPTNNNLQTIGSGAFSETKIKEIFIPPQISKISRSTFYPCEYLEKVVIPMNSNLRAIEKYAFSESKIEGIFIPPNVSRICESTFKNCKNLKRVVIPTNSNLRAIEKSAFSGTKIKYFFITPKISRISDNVFQNCVNLQIIEISEESKLKSFPLTAFDKNTALIIMIPTSLENLVHTNKPI